MKPVLGKTGLIVLDISFFLTKTKNVQTTVDAHVKKNIIIIKQLTLRELFILNMSNINVTIMHALEPNPDEKKYRNTLLSFKCNYLK